MKFWNWVKNEETGASELYLDGAIASETWWGDEVTPAMFQAELKSHPGDVTVWVNSPGGDVFAAAQIYTMLRNHGGRITVKIHGLAASAASVVAMAGDETLISPVGMLMIHNPSTCASGNKADMEQAIAILDEVKESIINAYAAKTGLSHKKLEQMMDDETWMDAKKAQKLGFVDGILFDDGEKEPDNTEPEPTNAVGMAFSPQKAVRSFLAKLQQNGQNPDKTVDAKALRARLDLLKN